jgi:hypothetical protein
VLSVAVACARTGWGLGALLASSSDGGMLTRRLWPTAIVVPLLIGTVSWKAYSVGLFSEWSEITVMVVAMITLMTALTLEWPEHRSQGRGTPTRRRVAASQRRRAEGGAAAGARGRLVVGSGDRHRHLV